MATQADIIKSVRELSFDRFFIPGIAFKAVPGYVLTIFENLLTISLATNEDEIKYAADLAVYNTFDKLAADLLEKQIVFAYTPYYSGEENTSQLIPINKIPLSADYTAYKKYFFSDDYILEQIKYYYYSVLNIKIAVFPTDVPAWLDKLVYPSETHLALKLAYWLVDKRRLYELSALHIGLNYTDGSVFSVSSAPDTGTESVTVQIGSVFTLTENPHNGELTENFNSLGSDNVLGDKYSFWYRLLLYLRGKIEEQFGDYSLRPDTVINSDSYLDRSDLNFRSYFDSYPFSVTPLVRGIINNVN